MRNWSDLPDELIEHITSLLALSDLHRFSAVCRTWRLVAKQKSNAPAKEIPWLLLGEDTATHKRQFFNLSENRHYYIAIPELQGQYLCGSSYGWLFTVDIDLKFRMLNPFTRKCYDLPPLPRCLLCELRTCKCITVNASERTTRLLEFPQHRLVYKAILDHDPSQCSDFKVLIVYGSNRHKLAFWMPGHLNWTQITTLAYSSYDDIIFLKGIFYVISFPVSYIFMVDAISGANPILAVVELYPLIMNHCSKYLVNFMGTLLILDRQKIITQENRQATVRFHVYQFDLEEKKLSKCKHISGFALFVGNNAAVVIDPSQFPGCRKNTIYYTHTTASFSDRCGWYDLGIYDTATDTTMRYYPQDIYHPVTAPPIWLNLNA